MFFGISLFKVINYIDSFSKSSTKDNVERELTLSDNNRLDTSPTQNMGVIVSPKKKLLIRSQSRTESASPTSISTNQYSQSQKLSLDDESSTDDDINQFQRAHDVSMLAHTINSNTQLNTNVESSHLRTNPTIVKQQPMIPTNKRTFSHAVIGN